MEDAVVAMGRRKQRRQSEFWVITQNLPRSPGHPFYEQLNQVIDAAGFDQFCEGICRQFYAEKMGRPSIPPEVYFRMLMVGYSEKIDSEKGIAWRRSDSLSLRSFLGLKDETAAVRRLCVLWNGLTARLQRCSRMAAAIGWSTAACHVRPLAA